MSVAKRCRRRCIHAEDWVACNRVVLGNYEDEEVKASLHLRNAFLESLKPKCPDQPETLSISFADQCTLVELIPELQLSSNDIFKFDNGALASCLSEAWVALIIGNNEWLFIS